MKLLLAPFFALFLFACAPAAKAPPAAAMDPIAEAFVKLALEIGEHEPGYIDAYHGPEEWAQAAKANKRDTESLRIATEGLIHDLKALDPKGFSPLEQKRRAYLMATLSAAHFRLRMIEGEKPGFVAEAQALFNVTPAFKPLEAYKADIAAIEAVVPGKGALAPRIEAFRKRFEIPADRLDAVMQAAIAECRSRTIAHIPLPEEESFSLEFVKDKPWSGYNWFKGNAKSLIQINTDNPVLIDRAVDLGCHEGYPGHHVHNVLMEQKLYRERAWVEFSVWPLYAPIGLVAEGTSNAGISLAFPGEEKLRFEQEKLYPLAGLDPKLAPALDALNKASAALAGARYAIADQYLSGAITRAQAEAMTQEYLLRSPARAKKDLDFLDEYRSYIVNYGLGQEMAEAYLARAGADPKARWAAMEALLSEPTLPADLTP